MDTKIIELLILTFSVTLSILLYYIGRKKEAKKVIYYLVHEAERRFGSGKGDIKYAYVVARVYPKLPKMIRLFMTEKKLDNLIDQNVKELENKLNS